jgi:hypothetical protein
MLDRRTGHLGNRHSGRRKDFLGSVPRNEHDADENVAGYIVWSC